FSGELPLTWAPTLRLIDALIEVLDNPSEQDPSLRRAEAARVRRALLEEARDCIQQAPAPLGQDSPEHRRWFTEAALLWQWFSASCGKVRVDTLGSPSLGNYPVDFEPTQADRATLRAALERAFGWSTAQMEGLERKLSHITSNLRLKSVLSVEIAAMLEGPMSPEGLMNKLYGTLPWRHGDIEVVVTEASIFMCPRMGAEGLTVAGFAQRPEAERRPIIAFLKRAQGASQSIKTVRFPAFGYYDRESVDDALIARLVEAVRQRPELGPVSAAVVSETLATMTLFVPADDAEMYLIHDTWGHGWQETLCEFEWLFETFDSLRDPVPFDSLTPAFEVTHEGRVRLHEDRLHAAVEADLRGRIATGVNLVVAEGLADLMEYKYGRFIAPLPTSSLFPEGILKLDLTIQDTRRMARLWSHPYRALAQDGQTRRALLDHLRAEGRPEAGLEEVYDEAIAFIEAHFGGVLAHVAPTQPKVEGLMSADLMHRLILSMACLEAALEDLIATGESRLKAMRQTRGADTPRWHCPAACIDFVALLLGWFYDQEQEVHVWHMDELVAYEVLPNLLRLEHALADVS
ncbi:MAG: hypothetical protein AAFS10_18950, partial [Myxococcota bacterium]